MTALPTLRRAAYWLHRSMSGSTRVSRWYLTGLAAAVRRLPDSLWKRRITNHLQTIPWPELRFSAKPVRVEGVSIRLVPHVREFDFAALFTRDLEYEREVFRCLRPRMRSYDAVLEVGANVGVYTLFFAHQFSQLDRAGVVFAFEPSREAYFRLQENVRVNGFDNIHTFNCAVAEGTGLLTFYEPQGHLTNGSLYREFAEVFSRSIQTSRVLGVGGEVLDALLADHESALVKLDVEGAEPIVLRGLEGLIRRRTPEIVLEVLSVQEEALNDLAFVRELYQLFNITDDGLVASDRFVATPWRDYLLLPKGRGSIRTEPTTA